MLYVSIKQPGQLEMRPRNVFKKYSEVRGQVQPTKENEVFCSLAYNQFLCSEDAFLPDFHHAQSWQTACHYKVQTEVKLEN